jgi:hypothetical protein
MPFSPSKILKFTQVYAWQGLAILVFVGGLIPGWVSRWYTHLFFAVATKGVRVLLGKIPFAIGEWVYFILIILLIYKLLHKLLKIKYKTNRPFLWTNSLYSWSRRFAILYVLFELVWGLNYQKNSPASQFGLQVPSQYTEAQMDSLSLIYIGQLNEIRANLGALNPEISIYRENKGQNTPFFDSVISRAIKSYNLAAMTYPFLEYTHPNIKKAIFPRLGDKVGYLAFYQPLTTEAIIRGDLPFFTLPFTLCHEMAHQLGYASESEANFIAYQVALTSQEPFLKYSMLLQMFTYSQQAHLALIAKRNDFEGWKKIAARNKQLLSPEVLEDRKKIRAFFQERMGERIPGSEKLYDQFLIWNQQTKGIESYNDVLLWALAKPVAH